MSDQDLNKFRSVVREELKPVNEKLEALWDQTAKLTEDATGVKETLADVKTSLKNQDGALKRIEKGLDQNSDDVKKVDKRLTSVEDRSGIVPPPEFTLAR